MTGNLEMVQAVFTPNTDVNKEVRWRAPIYLAADSGNKDIVRILLESPKLLRSGENESAMISAFEDGNFEIGWMIFEHADKQALDLKDLVPDCLKMLIDVHGAIDQVRTLLDKATTIKGSSERMEEWLRKGMDQAVEAGHEQILCLLLERGAKLQDCFKNVHMNTVVSLNAAGVARMLLDAGFQRPKEDWYKDLQWAAKLDNADIIRLLLLRNVVHLDEDSDLARQSKAIMMGFACAFGNVDLVRLYVEKGIPVDAPYYESVIDVQPIVVAAAYGQSVVERALLELGAEPVDPLSTKWKERFTSGTVPLNSLKDQLIQKSEKNDRAWRSYWCCGVEL
ncbi:uncharacterized protein K452DRAFT_302244 [Aplosporella prunicola CBS 121167]|uniref:Uncharacterized protein n=1 Tax=Aplosporella prunicola CBS 121167 TaxID=1176127 RepID=A0A6A6B0Y0_9PEZI|nr:uncharacterized protein K452DRAFT_302244 [Aplosporella prunicola CBS 121167]KAF2137083.1 hypothetical protein K452DRAFT_302244 [Aplosporella prunicola CBS 121167]